MAALTLADEGKATAAFRDYLVNPARIKAVLAVQQDRQAVDQLLDWTGLTAAAAMLDALETADSRATRRQIMGRLASMGAEIGPLILERLERGPWFVQRNMLYLLGEMERIPSGFSPQSFLEHEDPRVRREAIKVALRVPGWREEAIIAGLADGDTRMLNLVLGAALEGSPPGIARPLIRLLETTPLETGLRTLAIRVLSHTRASDARDWLIDRVLRRRRLFSRGALAPKSPEMIVALRALNLYWPTHPRASRVLRIAARSEDREIREVTESLEPHL